MSFVSKFTSGPIEVFNDDDEKTSEGYEYSSYSEFRDEYTDDDGEIHYTSESNVEYWEIYSNGKFKYGVCSDTKRWCGDCEGTFDPSKYEEYVNQMKEYKTDWMKGLSYDKDSYNFTWG